MVQLSIGGEIGQDVVSLQSISGRNVSVPNIPFVCASKFPLENLADGITGMAALGRSNISLPVYFSSAFGIPRISAVCLSSLTNSSGVIFFGDGPYSIIPSNLLIYTPLIRNPVSTAGSYVEGEPSTDYFIGVKSIRVDREDNVGTRNGTVHPHTVLHTAIYKPFVKAFVKQMRAIFMTQVEPPIAVSFGPCFQLIDGYNSNEYGPVVPFIDLYWRAKAMFIGGFGVQIQW
ncbi:basic 7S globulin 2 precursor small subunit, putative [Ricinus communis]|uniref:Basic 7S globulin 2 small subunit, putative n=1 Tax=Ricinus communis TaxID=3988 RepID=B9RTV7_RICCO|nr:basic 7S globulin 2 precursor small subunit, putative [Ricinus communis]